VAVVTAAETVVVGGGVHGASSAYFLARAGIQVVLVEKARVGSGSSGASGGIIRCHYTNEVMVRLAHRAAVMWPSLEDELGRPLDYVQNGLIIAVSPDDAEHLEDATRMQRRLGVDTTIIGAEEIRRWIPEFRTEGLALAAYEAGAGYADPYATASAFTGKARELGAEVVTDTIVTGIEMNGTRVRGVVTDRGRIDTPLVVNCAGPWAARVAGMAGIELPVRVGMLQMTAGNPRYSGWTRVSPTWIDMTTMTYCRPDASGLMLAGGGRTENSDLAAQELDPDRCPSRPPMLFEAEIHDNLVRRCPWATGMPRVRSWTGPDGISPDFHLIFGPVPGVHGYLQVVGGSGNSFKLCPATGEAVAEYVITGRCTHLDTDAFSIARFAENRPFRGGYQMSITG
jgi:sarcosine oxidase subunit beta